MRAAQARTQARIEIRSEQHEDRGARRASGNAKRPGGRRAAAAHVEPVPVRESPQATPTAWLDARKRFAGLDLDFDSRWWAQIASADGR